MATTNNTDGIRPVTHSNAFPPAAAARIAGSLLNRHSPHEIAEAIEILLDVLDLMGGDPDVELNGDEEEPCGDETDAAWMEWHTMRGSAKRGANFAGRHEDDEEDGEDCDGFENEPLFDRRQCAKLNAMYGDGPGGGLLVDSDCGHDGS